MATVRDKGIHSDAGMAPGDGGLQPETGADTEPAPLALRRVEAGDPQLGQRCPFCHCPYAIGDLIKTVPGGPANAAELAKARRGLSYVSGPPFELHEDCGDPQGTAASIGGRP